MHCVHLLQVDKELASGEYFLKEKERVAKKKELKKVLFIVHNSNITKAECFFCVFFKCTVYNIIIHGIHCT